MLFLIETVDNIILYQWYAKSHGKPSQAIVCIYSSKEHRLVNILYN